MLLSKEQTDLMTWLEKQLEPVAMAAMQHAEAPGYSMDRVNKMYKDGLLESTYVFYTGESVPGYRVSDKGRASLREYNRSNQQHLFNEVRAWITLAIAVGSLVTAIISLLR